MITKHLVSLLIAAILPTFLLAQEIQDLKLEYGASQNNQACFTLTADKEWEVGAIWSKTKVPINQDFSYTFKANFGSKQDPLGADGIAFVFAQNNRIIDTTGGQYLGVRNLAPALHLELDVFQNINAPDDFNDPNMSHLAFFKNGDGKHRGVNCLTKIPSNDGWIQLHETKTNVQDGAWYDIEIRYNATSKQLDAYVDNSLRNSITLDIANDIFNGQTTAYWGITASTGGASNVHQVCFNWDTTQTTNAEKDYVLPNAFSPDGNGPIINENYFVVTANGTQVTRLLIYNRWGQILFDGPNKWDGSHNGKTVPPGVYLVVAELQRLDGSTEKVTGDITVFR